MANHAATAMYCDPKQRKRLEHLEASGSTPQKMALRARLILRAADGIANVAIARELGVSRPTVRLWRERFASAGVPGIMADAPRPGRKQALSPEKEKAVVEATLHTTPPGQTHWSVREMAKAQGISRMAVQRIWKRHNLQPHRIETFKLSRDQHFVEKLRDVVGLYLSPPDKALVLSVDEKRCVFGRPAKTENPCGGIVAASWIKRWIWRGGLAGAVVKAGSGMHRSSRGAALS